MTLHEQKTALAEWAPDLLFADPTFDCFCWNIDGLLITDREWLEVAWRLEERLDAIKNIIPDDQGEETQQQAYWCELERVVGRDCAEEDIYWHTTHAAAPARLEALCRTLFPERFK